MVYQCDVDPGAECLKRLERGVERAAPHPQFVVIVVALAEQRAVDWQYTDLIAPDLDRLHRAARRVFGQRPDAFEVAVVPLEKRAQFLRQVGLGDIRTEVGVGLRSEERR